MFFKENNCYSEDLVTELDNSGLDEVKVLELFKEWQKNKKKPVKIRQKKCYFPPKFWRILFLVV